MTLNLFVKLFLVLISFFEMYPIPPLECNIKESVVFFDLPRNDVANPNGFTDDIIFERDSSFWFLILLIICNAWFQRTKIGYLDKFLFVVFFEVLVKTRAIREKEESLIVNGSASTDATQFSGIVTLQSTVNKVDKNTTAMTLDDINTAIQYSFDDGGRPNLAVCASAVYTDLLGLLTAKIGYMQPVQQVFWGFSTIVLNTMVGQIPVIPSMYLSNTTAEKAIYFLDMSVWEMRVLQDLTYQDLAKTNDSEKFMLKIYEALICKNTAFNSFIGEIA